MIYSKKNYYFCLYLPSYLFDLACPLTGLLEMFIFLNLNRLVLDRSFASESLLMIRTWSPLWWWFLALAVWFTFRRIIFGGFSCFCWCTGWNAADRYEHDESEDDSEEQLEWKPSLWLLVLLGDSSFCSMNSAALRRTSIVVSIITMWLLYLALDGEQLIKRSLKLEFV